MKLISADDLRDFPPPSWLIDGLIEEGAFAVVYGASGEGKSFVALDWALSIAAGRPWQGRSVEGGSVVYVAGEGGRNIGKRIAAWKNLNGVASVPDAFVVMEAVQLGSSEQVTAFISAVETTVLCPQLIVFDTLARCFVGGDENSSREMGEFVEACSRVQREVGATVLVIHHTGKPRGQRKTSERGSYALRGAADVMIRVTKNLDVITVAVDKQKDDEAADPISVRLTEVTVSMDAASGRLVTSCALVASDTTEEPASVFIFGGLLDTLKVLAAFPNSMAHSGDWRKNLPPRNGKAVPEKTFQNQKNKLLEERLVEAVEGRQHWYRATDKWTAMATEMPLDIQLSPLTQAAATATPPKGVAGGIAEAWEATVLSAPERSEVSTP